MAPHPPPEPPNIAKLPHDRHGRPIPWFVAMVHGEPDFRIIKPGAIGAALTKRLCWVCGVPQSRAEHQAFTVGPMCAVNRNSAEPPGHYECSSYSAQACPFLTTPGMVRRTRHLPPGTSDPAGVFIRRNPGLALVWVAKPGTWSAHRAGDGLLFDIGTPAWVEWFAQGRKATRAEVLASMRSGLPILNDSAVRHGGAEALAQVAVQYRAALALVPR